MRVPGAFSGARQVHRPRGQAADVTVRFLSSGDAALVVEFGDRIERRLSEEVLRLAAQIRRAALAGIVETVPTLRSLMVHYDPLKTSAAKLKRAIEALMGAKGRLEQEARLWRVPVCYEGEFAPDLAYVAKETRLAAEEVVTLHAGQRYHVYMIGFLPGLPYMGDLPERLVLPRRVDPRVRLPPGSVAIATTMTIIYPLECPGGWHIIGATPVRLFDAQLPAPALLAPGDAVEFEAIDKRSFAKVRAAVERGDYQVPHERLSP